MFESGMLLLYRCVRKWNGTSDIKIKTEMIITFPERQDLIKLSQTKTKKKIVRCEFDRLNG